MYVPGPPVGFRPIDPQATAGEYLLRLLAGQTRSPFRAVWPPLVQPLGAQVGRLSEGRPIMENLGPEGGYSTHSNIRVSFGDPPQHYVIPTLYGGEAVTDDEAVEIFRRARGFDPDTGIRWPAFDSDAAAHAYEDAAHRGLEQQLWQRGLQP